MSIPLPIDPTTPRDPVLVPRPRPGTVTLAAVLLLFGAVLGLVSAVTFFAASAVVVDRFRDTSAGSDATATEIEATADVIRSAFVASGVGTILLAIFAAVLAVGILRRNNSARIGALGVVAASLACGLVGTSVTALGRNVNWTVNVDNASDRLGAQLAQAYTEAVPSWLVGGTGGLTDLQTLGYIAVAALLLVPVSHEYFRKRTPPPEPSP